MQAKKRAPAPAPTKAPPPPAKQAAPPQSAPAPKPAAPEQGADFSETPAQSASPTPTPAVTPTLTPSLQLNPRLLPGLGAVGPEDASGGYRLPPDFFKFTADPASQIDWLAMRQPFLTRGVMVGDLELKTIEQNWRFTYTSMVNLGLSPELSVKIANIGTPLAYDFSLARDNPTAEERMDQAFEKMLPPGEKLPTKIVVPVITPDTLQWVTKKVTGKDIDFRF